MKIPNAILINKTDSSTGKRWNVIYIKTGVETYTHVGSEYVKTDDITNFDPFVNWLDYIPDKEWVHPVVATPSNNGGWDVCAFDGFHNVTYNGKDTTLDFLYSNNLLFKMFDKLLKSYEN
jgi:hypothetical protein